MGTKVVPRPTARVLITNDDGRLLLFHCRTSLDRPDDLCWITPGGGVRAGEILAAAAVREETGIVMTPDQLGGVIAYAQVNLDAHCDEGNPRTPLVFGQHRVGDGENRHVKRVSLSSTVSCSTGYGNRTPRWLSRVSHLGERHSG